MFAFVNSNQMETDIKFLLGIAQEAALAAGKAIMEVYRSGEFSTEIKQENNSPVTEADTRAHRVITDYLAGTNMPVLSEEGKDIDFAERKDWEYFWLVDPLDGTKEFINMNAEFTVNIALMHRNAPVAGVIYAPALDIVYVGSKETGVFKIENGHLVPLAALQKRKQFNDLLQCEQLVVVASRSHMSPDTKAYINQLKNVALTSMGSSLKFMLLLESRADIYPRLGTTMEWDTAAAHAILNASNRGIYHTDLQSELVYNKQDLRNPFFVAF